MKLKYVFILLIVLIAACNNKTEKQTVSDMIANNELLEKSDLVDKSLEELRLIRNEIFARHGYVFQSKDLKEYFERFHWYNPSKIDVNELLSEVDKRNIELLKLIEKKKLEEIRNISIVGQWLNYKYYKTLKLTKSPRLAQQSIYLAYIEFNENSKSSMIFNFHEGIDCTYKREGHNIQLEFFSNEKFRAKILNLNTIEIHYNNSIDTLIRYNVLNKNRFPIAVNNIVFKGNYNNMENDSSICFKSSGNLAGLDSFNQYRVSVDYLDAAMGLDQVKLLNGTESKNVTWIINTDTLLLYEVICSKYDSIDNFCYEIDKGKLLYKLLKIND